MPSEDVIQRTIDNAVFLYKVESSVNNPNKVIYVAAHDIYRALKKHSEESGVATDSVVKIERMSEIIIGGTK